jgi:hypothetical protein
MNNIKDTLIFGFLSSITYFFTYGISSSIFAGKYNRYSIFGNMKDAITIAQIIGYTIGKIVIYYNISKIKKECRFKFSILTIICSTIPLIIFGLLPDDSAIVMILLSSIFISFAWGSIIFYVEGKSNNELIYMLIYFGVISGSGVAKTFGDYLINKNINEKWIPAICGVCGMNGYIIFLIILHLYNKNNILDRHNRQSNISQEQRTQFMKKYKIGLVSTALVYGLLLGYRNYRDYYSLEILHEILGQNFKSGVYAYSEIIISVSVLFTNGLLFMIKSDRMKFYFMLYQMLIGGIIIGISTIFTINSYLWIILTGFGLFVGYIPARAMLYDKLMSITHNNFSAVYLIYFADSIGYIFTIIVIIIKKYSVEISYVDYFVILSYIVAGFSIINMIISIIFFYMKLKFISDIIF